MVRLYWYRQGFSTKPNEQSILFAAACFSLSSGSEEQTLCLQKSSSQGHSVMLLNVCGVSSASQVLIRRATSSQDDSARVLATSAFLPRFFL